jgi:hypothetical protein
MSLRYIIRRAESFLRELANGFPVIVITGPRQSGKTTLARHVFPEKEYTSLEDPDTRRFAEEDPRGFLDRYSEGAVFDEVHKAPELLSYLQRQVDEAQRAGLYVLTGSQQFDVLSGVSQSLAGRAALLSLLPFSAAELAKAGKARETLEETIFSGGYPPIFSRDVKPAVWLGNYIRTYLERDVRTMVNVRDLGLFRDFTRLCAGRTGQILNLSALASDCGISHNTARGWLSVLEASYIVHLLPPYYRNFNKRITKSPKLHFIDTGLAARLLGIENYRQIETHPLRGALFESYVVSEFLKSRLNEGREPNLFFWRDNHGVEIDLVVEDGGKIDFYEIKSGKTVPGDFQRNLALLRERARDLAGRSGLIYGGDETFSFKGFEIRSWRNLAGLPWA